MLNLPPHTPRDAERESTMPTAHAPSDIDSAELEDGVALVAHLLDAPLVTLAVIDRDDSYPLVHLGPLPIPDVLLLRAGNAVPLALIPDVQAEPALAADPMVRQCRIGAFLGLALFDAKRRCIGILGAADDKPRLRFGSGGAEQLARIARVMAQLLDRRQLRHRQQTVTQVLDRVHAPIIVCDPQQRVDFANRAAMELFDAPDAPLFGRQIEGLLLDVSNDPRIDFDDWLRHRDHAEGENCNVRNLHIAAPGGNGTRILQASHCRWELSGKSGSSLVMHDITDQHRQQSRLREVAMSDSLTGLPNRLAVLEQLTTLLERGVRPIGVAILDIARFKDINDTLGHAVGDGFLQLVSSRLQSQLPAGSTLARIGSNDFALLCPGLDDASMPAQLRQMLDAASQPCHLDGHVVQGDAHCGFVVLEEDDAPCKGSELLARADLALYRAKAQHDRTPRRFDESMRNDAIKHRRMELELRRAHQNGEFELHYQPQVEVGSGNVIGAEALLRWRHPERGLLAPLHFIDALSGSPIASAVGAWILRQGCRDAMAWPPGPDGAPLRVSVNLFPAQINDGRLPTMVGEALAESGLPAERLELEITEFIALRPDDNTTEMMRNVRNLGVRLAFDDFGTGYASLSVLQRFPINSIKIDRSFVRHLLDNDNDAAIVQALAMICRRLGLGMVAEGIEDESQAALLHSYGCSGAQGYLYAPALAQDDFIDWVANRTRQSLDQNNHG